VRAWLFYLVFSVQRQARARLMVWVSLGLLGLVALLVQINTRLDRWNFGEFRFTYRPPEPPPSAFELKSGLKPLIPSPEPVRMRMGEVLAIAQLPGRLPNDAGVTAGPAAVAGMLRAAMYEGAGLRLFVAVVIVGLLASFLMPLWTLTFAAESLGRNRENRTLTWLLLRPLPRPTLYFASYLAALPWCLLLNLGGYFLLCGLGGQPGRQALPMFALPILLGTLAFAALFQLLSITFRRAGILGLVYVFFFETIAGNLPGQQKRLSLSYYVRCLMVDRLNEAGVSIDLAGTRPAVSGDTAMWVLMGVTLVLLLIGMWIFSRKEYVETAGN
jgi:ABC-type transport system involved in multi-copper enzyme maturation permease subunit